MSNVTTTTVGKRTSIVDRHPRADRTPRGRSSPVIPGQHELRRFQLVRSLFIADPEPLVGLSVAMRNVYVSEGRIQDVRFPQFPTEPRVVLSKLGKRFPAISPRCRRLSGANVLSSASDFDSLIDVAQSSSRTGRRTTR